VLSLPSSRDRSGAVGAARPPDPEGVTTGRSASNVAISRGIGAQLLITVPGPVRVSEVLGKLSAPRIADGGPIKLSLPVRNLGTAHRDYLHPDELVAQVGAERVTFPEFTVLRGSTRVLETNWTDPPLACLCRVRVATDDGQGHALVASTRILVFPFRLLAGVLLLAVGLALLTRTTRRRRRQARERELAQARQEAYEQARREAVASTRP